jgi:hypothetical protein
VTRRELGDDGLREAFQSLPRRTAEGEACPPPEEIWAAARGELDPRASRRLIDHTGRCPSCAEDWRLARHLAARGPGVAVEPAESPPRRRRAPRWLAAAAVFVAVALGGSWLFLSQDREREPVFRVEPRTAVESLIPEDRPLPRDEPVLRWRGPEGASYRLVVTDERLRLLAREERVTGSEYRLPDEVLAAVPPGGVILWQLEATLPDGSRLPSQTFRVKLE